jgi:hypothetical protein
MIIGIDDKVAFDKTGKQVRRPAAKDSVAIVDISNPEALKIVANLPMMNSVFGPPTQPGHRGQLGRLAEGRRELEGRAGQQALRH